MRPGPRRRLDGGARPAGRARRDGGARRQRRVPLPARERRSRRLRTDQHQPARSLRRPEGAVIRGRRGCGAPDPSAALPAEWASRSKCGKSRGRSRLPHSVIHGRGTISVENRAGEPRAILRLVSPVNLVGLLPAELEALAVELGHSRFRGRQLATWMYRKGVVDLGRDDRPAQRIPRRARRASVPGHARRRNGSRRRRTAAASSSSGSPTTRW